MEYKLLSSLYYTNKKAYETEYLNRLKSANTIKPNIEISGSPAFILITDEVSHIISSIQSRNRNLELLTEKMQSDSLQIYRSSQLSYEAVMTNDLEGVASTRKDIISILEKVRKNKTFRGAAKKFHGMVKSYDELAQNASVSIKTCSDIREIYDQVALAEVISSDKQNKPDGQYFRKDAVNVLNVKSGKVIHSGIYPEEKLNEAMTAALDFLNDDNINILIRISAFHYLFGYIHPFYDGNGRTSRFISSRLLSANFNSLSGYWLANIIGENVNSYYKMFNTVNDEKNKGDITPFVIYFLGVLQKLFDELCEDISQKSEQYAYYENKISTGFSNTEERSVMLAVLKATVFDSGAVSESGLTRETISTMCSLSKNDVVNITNKFTDLFDIAKDGNYNRYKLLLNKLDASE